MGKLIRRIHFLLNRRRLERELAEEMEAHRDMMPPARRSHFGSSARLHEDAREVWSAVWLEQILQDLAYGARMLLRSPGFTLGAIAVLALGVGVNLAEFQIFSAILHRLNIRDADTLLQFSHNSRQGDRLGFPHGAVEFYRQESRSFVWLVAEDSSFNTAMEADPDVRGTFVSDNFFASLGVLPAYGRLLDARDGQPGAAPVVILGYEYWRTNFGANPNVVGRTVHIGSQPLQIAGVLPYTLTQTLMGRRADIWLPVSLRAVLMTGTPPIEGDFSRATEELFGKLKPGVSLAAAQEELTSLTRALVQQHPLTFQDDERMVGHLVLDANASIFSKSPAVAIVVVMILLVLISACANLGNMLLARGLVRQREIDIRMAIGASRARVVRQLMTENFVLAILGSAAGLAFGAAASRLLLVLMQAPHWVRLTTGWQIFAVTFALTMLSAFAFGLPSALQTVRVNQRKAHLRQGLIGTQVAVSCLLLIASGVLAHNALLNASIDFAFDYRNMLVVYPQLYGRNLSPAAAQQKMDALTARFRALPGVDGVTAAVIPPLSGRMRTDNLPGLPHVYRNAVAPSYFAVMQLPVLRGRTFLPGERNALIVSESAARAIWPNQDAVGKLLTLAGAERTVVGVAKDSGANLVADVDSIEAYTPITGSDAAATTLILHTPGDPAPLVRLVPGSAEAVKERVSMIPMRTLRENQVASERSIVTVIGSIGVVATTLAAAGMFALVAFTVAQRTREIGIRMAIGAGPRHILDVLLRQNARPTAVGAIAGVLLATALARLVRSQIPLQKHDTVDIVGFAAGLACFALIGLLATLSPALRALRIDPSTTLREE